MDSATVAVRSRWSPFARTVYSGPGVPNIVRERRPDPELTWVTNRHLLVRYDYYPGYEQTCRTKVLDVEVTCLQIDSRK